MEKIWLGFFINKCNNLNFLYVKLINLFFIYICFDVIIIKIFFKFNEFLGILVVYLCNKVLIFVKSILGLNGFVI